MTPNEIAMQMAANTREMERLWAENEALATDEFRAGAEPRQRGKAEAASQALEMALQHYHRALFDAAQSHVDVTVNFGK